MYLTFWLVTLFGLDITLTSIIVLLAMGLFGYAAVRFLIEGILKDPELNQLLITFALSIILQNAFLLLWGADFRAIRVEAVSYNIGGILIPYHKLLAFIVAVLASAALYLVLMRTRLGVWIRAVAQDPVTSEAIGINARGIRTLTFAIGSISAGLAGILIKIININALASSTL